MEHSRDADAVLIWAITGLLNMEKQYREYLIEGERAGMRYAFTVPRSALTGLTGVQLGRVTGSSLDFKDYREYQPGDDLRCIDWGVYARSDKLTVKLYREEVSPHVDIFLDCSGSMALADTQKVRAALGLSAILASAAANVQCTHTMWMVSNGFHQAGNAHECPSLWEGIDFKGGSNPEDSFGVMPPAWRRHGIRILISDLFWLGDPLQTLRRFSDRAAALAVVQLLAEADTRPPALGNTRLVDVETGEPMEVFIDAVAQRKYQDALSAHQQNWLHACRQTGAIMTTLVAEDITGHWRLDALEKAEILDAA